MPGNPHAVAVSRFDPGLSPDYLGVNIYDDGIARPPAAGVDNTATGAHFIEFSPSRSRKGDSYRPDAHDSRSRGRY